MAKTASRVSTSRSSVNWKSPWNKQHYTYLGGAIAVIVAGFLLLAKGMYSTWDDPLSVDVAPVVLVVGYCILVPLAIMRRNSSDSTSNEG
ncbi:MAG: hypothetical protein ACK45E_01445 [Ignavibacteria bacterium]|jgi:hypothetical protein